MHQFFSSFHCLTIGLIVHFFGCDSADTKIFNFHFLYFPSLLGYFVFLAELEESSSDPFVCLQLFNFWLPVF